jgi:hypothetical protein
MVSKMAEQISHQLGNASQLQYVKKDVFTDAEKSAMWEDDRKWYIDVNVTRAKLQSYYPDTKIAERWDDYMLVLFTLAEASRHYFEQDVNERSRLGGDLELIKKYFQNDKSIIKWDRLTTAYDSPLWDSVIDLVRKRGDEIIGDVLKFPIKAF